MKKSPRGLMSIVIWLGTFLLIAILLNGSLGNPENKRIEYQVLKDLDRDIVGQDVLIVEDIVDSGMTLSYLKKMLADRGAASIKIVTLLDKPARRRVELKADYFCFIIPDEFVVGYGLDYDEKYRNIPDIGVLHPRIYGAE